VAVGVGEVVEERCTGRAAGGVAGVALRGTAVRGVRLADVVGSAGAVEAVGFVG
jgi:hypothetical protein